MNYSKRLKVPSGRRKYAITAKAYNKAGKLLAVGNNSYTKTHPVQRKYALKANKPDAIYLHAEIHALIQARENVHRLVITRYDRRGHPKNAAPCEICQLAIKDFNVKHIEHT